MPRQIFVYGNLLPGQPAFSLLEKKVENPRRASTAGILMFHDTGEEEFPFLIRDERLLKILEENTGIGSGKVQGEVYDIKEGEEDLLGRLDEYEGVSPMLPGLVPEPSARSRDLYVRRAIAIQTEHGQHHQAWAYVANPHKDHTRRLVKGGIHKLIIPRGDWARFYDERKDCSLRFPLTVDTFGMETEFALAVKSRNEETPLPLLRERGKYRLEFSDGKRARFSKLSTMLAQLLFDSLSSSSLDPAVLRGYSELHPQVNSRFLIPFGFAYVEGEQIDDDGRRVGIQRLGNQPWIEHQDLVSPERAGSRSLPLDQIFFEGSGFPATVEKGFSSQYASTEMIRRYHLTLALEDIVAIRCKGKTFRNISVQGNSSQYNIILNPRRGGLDFSKVKVDFKGSANHEDHEPISKFTRDVAYLLGKTFGPLLSFFLSGSTTGFVDYKTRPDDRLEYRNTVLQTPQQLAAGIAVYVAAVKTVEEVLKERIMQEISRESATSKDKLREHDILEWYAKIHPDQFLDAFTFSFPGVQYVESITRPGFKEGKEKSIHSQICSSPEAIVEVQMHGQKTSLPVRRLIEGLFLEKTFNRHLRDITTTAEYDHISMFGSGEQEVEVYRAMSGTFTSKRSSRYVRSFSSLSIEEHYKATSTFPHFYTHLLFCQGGKHKYQDGTHLLTVETEKALDSPASALLLESIPLQICLYQRARMAEPVDIISTRITPHNVQRVQRALNTLEARELFKVWEVFYKLK